MAEIIQLYDRDTTHNQYPITVQDAVLDLEGTTLTTTLVNVSASIMELSSSIEDVDIDPITNSEIYDIIYNLDIY